MLTLFLCGLTVAACFTAARLAAAFAALAAELDAQAAILLAQAKRLDDLERLAYGLPVGGEEKRHAG